MNRQYERQQERNRTLAQRLDAVGDGVLQMAKEIAYRCGSSVEAVETGSRYSEHVKARHEIMHMLLERDLAFAHIGRIMGVHHTSVMAAYRKLASCAAEDE